MSNPPRASGPRCEQSPQWRDGRFHNRLPRVDGPRGRMLREFFFGGSPHRRPTSPIPVERRRAADFTSGPGSGLRVTWLGHSSTLLEIDDVRLLLDPVWAERVSPVPFVGPKRFFPPPLALADLPPLDAIVLSHDHYDHLDEALVRKLAARGVRWVVPLGVGDWLRKWGIEATAITELDWWETTRMGALSLTATPARHFSGRGIGSSNRTLWCGFGIAGPAHRVYYSGDTALQDEFVAIGERCGPFDLTIIEIGAYSWMWPDVHIGPEQAVLAHQLVRGDVMLPVHWGTFDLALHAWTEPIERALVAAARAGARLVAPRPGGMIEPTSVQPAAISHERWWPDVPWQTAEQAPVHSTGVTVRRLAA